MNNLRIEQLATEDHSAGQFVGRWEDDNGDTFETEPSLDPDKIAATLALLVDEYEKVGRDAYRA